MTTRPIGSRTLAKLLKCTIQHLNRQAETAKIDNWMEGHRAWLPEDVEQVIPYVKKSATSFSEASKAAIFNMAGWLR